MSFLSQTFQAGSSNNTGSVISIPNSRNGDTPLPDPPASPSFSGAWISGEKYAVIQCAIRSDTNCDLVIVQSFSPVDGTGVDSIVYNYIDPGSQPLKTVYYYITCPWIKVYVENLESGNTIFELSTKLSLTPPPASSTVQPISGTVSVDNFPAVQDVSGTVAVSNFPATQPVSGTVTVSNLPAQQTVYGENSNYVFYATPATNVPAVYADGIQGTNVAGGWSYANTTTTGTKINWYCYSSSSVSTDYKVSQLNSMYAVINQKSTLGLSQAQNPWIMFYTRMDSGTNNGSWYKNKLFFGSNADTDNTGLKLLYTGADPVDIHPEITGTSRIQLQFVLAQSTTTLALAQAEDIMLGSLQTTAVTVLTPANSFYFTFQEFGCDWVKTPAILPIEFGAVQVAGTVNMLNKTVVNPFTYSIITGLSFTTDVMNVQNFSTVDLYLSAGSVSILTDTEMIFDVQYSPDGATWFNSGLTLTLNPIQTQALSIGNVTATSYIRLNYVASVSTNSVSQVKYWVNAKSL